MPQNLRLEYLSPDDSQPNPLNWRKHPAFQTQVLEELIYDDKQGVGWAGAALINDRKVENGWSEDQAVPTFVDGHDRRLLAQKHGGTMPCLIGEWTPEQEAKILASLDPIASLAMPDFNVLDQVTSIIKNQSELFDRLMSNIVADTTEQQIETKATKERKLEQEKDRQVKIVIDIRQDLAIIEQALISAGNANRGKALVFICQEFLAKR